MNIDTTQTILIEASFEGGRRERCAIPLSAESCWAHLLGPWPLPSAGAIDTLGGLFGNDQPEQITLTACPSACLLPLLWIRTIWFPHDLPGLIIDWKQVADPAEDHGRQPAGKLACMLADEVRCGDNDAAWHKWGIRPGDDHIPEEAFDLLTNIIDLWDTDLHRVTQAAEWNEAIRRTLIHCATVGHRRIAIYGGGTHTRAVGDALMEPGVEIVCIIDDDTRRHGDTMWGYKIVSPERALTLDLDAVIISANSIEDTLWERAAPMRERGIDTLRIYSHSPADPDTALFEEIRS